jgi:hypothetical protein
VARETLVNRSIDLYQARNERLYRRRVARRIISQHPDVVRAEVDGAGVLLRRTTGSCVSLDEIAAYVWPLLAGPTAVDDVTERVAAHFRVPAATCRADVESCIEHLDANGLITSQ